jgi:hypothetical protein
LIQTVKQLHIYETDVIYSKNDIHNNFMVSD